MIAFPEMLFASCDKAKIPHPESMDGKKLDDIKQEFPVFYIFCLLQLCRRMSSPSEHWENAEVLSTIPVEEMKTMTLTDFMARGFHYCS